VPPRRGAAPPRTTPALASRANASRRRSRHPSGDPAGGEAARALAALGRRDVADPPAVGGLGAADRGGSGRAPVLRSEIVLPRGPLDAVPRACSCNGFTSDTAASCDATREETQPGSARLGGV